VVALVLVLTVAVIACREERRSAPGRVLVIGIDGAAPRLVEPWMQEGLLPNLARLAREGASGSLRSQLPLLSPRIWTSMATGKQPDGHGVENWVIPVGQGRLRLYRGSDRKGPAVWNIVSEAGYTVGVVNWLMTYPPEKINGVVISDFAIPGEREKRQDFGDGFSRAFGLGGVERQDAEHDAITAFPVDWIARVARLAKSGPRLEGVPDPAAPFEKWRYIRDTLARATFTDDLAASAALEVDRVLQPDLLMVLLPGIDRVSHFYWGGVEPPELYPQKTRPMPRQRLRWLKAMRSYYAYTDVLIGELVARFSREDLILVVSDHGFEAWTEEPGKTGNHTTEAALDGVVFARGPGISEGGRVQGMSVNDLTPSVLAWLGLPVARDMDGRPATFLTLPRLDRVASYDGVAIERVETSADDLEQAVIEELRTLGYIE
jgi:predicted AlkP superfamily phosphohydrolase/phosphomutase